MLVSVRVSHDERQAKKEGQFLTELLLIGCPREEGTKQSRPLQVLVRKLFTKMDHNLLNISPSPQKYLKTSTDREGLTGNAHMAMEVRVFQ